MSAMRLTQLLALAILIVLQRCSHDEARQSPYSTPESLLGEFRSMYKSSPPNMDGIIDLIVAENDTQDAWILYLRSRALQARLDNEAIARFGERVYEEPTTVMIWPVESFQIEARFEDRVRVRCTEDGMRPVTLHLVRINDGWWISGYSFENHPAHYHWDIDKLARWASETRPKVERVLSRLAAGEFLTLQELRTANDAAYGRLGE